MSTPLKKLFSQTAIYGLSSILARFLNYLLVPLHTSKAVFSTDQYGIISEMYSYVGFLIILLTYGMETAYFRFTSSEQSQRLKHVYSTVVVSLLCSTAIFIAFACTFANPIAIWLKYPNNAEFVVWFAFIVGLDAISSIPLARLRKENKAWRFVAVNFLNVFTNIGLNLFFLAYCMPKYNAGQSNWLIEMCYNPELGVSYVFIANLVASGLKFLVLSPMLFLDRLTFNIQTFKRALWYASPLLIAGLAGISNETLDRILLKRLLFDQLGETKALSEVGIYGACYKISIIITLFIQAFRYAAEPFFFNHSNRQDAKHIYARVMHYFSITCAIIFLGIMVYLDYIKYFVPNPAFWVGLKVVPILLLANICLGVYYNLSIWFKLTEKTIYGALIACVGAIITIALNLWLIPKISYMGSAYATLACYASMCVLAYLIGQRHLKIPYKLKPIFGYLAVSIILAQCALYFDAYIQKALTGTLFLIAFLSFIYIVELKPLLSKK